MNYKHPHAIFAACALWALTAATAQGADAVITSPDGRTTLRIAEDGTTFSVARRGETVIDASPLGLELAGAPAFGALKLESRDDDATSVAHWTRNDALCRLAVARARSAGAVSGGWR